MSDLGLVPPSFPQCPRCIRTKILAAIAVFFTPVGQGFADSSTSAHASVKVDTCTPLTWDGTKSTPSVDKNLDNAIANILKGMKSQNAELLQSAYHPRLHIPKEFVSELFSKINLVAKAPADASVFKIWRVNSTTAAGEKVQCENYGFYPIFGYPEQIPVMIQVLGQNELSHFLTILVKSEAEWKIGASQYLQKTHDGKNADMWLREGIEDQKAMNTVAAFSKVEIAKRLIQDRRYLEDPLLPTIAEIQAQMPSEKMWEQTIRDAAKPAGATIQRINTILAKTGIGLLLVIGIDKEESLTTLRNQCRNLGKTLDQQRFFKNFGSIKCSFTLPKEKFGEEGKLGGLFMKREDWQTN